MTLEERIQALTEPSVDPIARYYTDFDELKIVAEAIRAEGKKIVLTQGVYDLLHIGHAQYLAKAKAQGDVLIVGVDSDALTKQRKGDGRPVVPEDERTNMILHLRDVDMVVLRDVDKELEALIETIKPDVYIASTSTKDFTVSPELAKHCGEVRTLPPQATTSTSARVQQVSMLGADELAAELSKQMPQMVHNMLNQIKNKK
ncbi:MAG: rfaE bifunctional protein nucleotidyltransferase chain/domain [Patiriisocius sp.]|jgi:rfaE bifunctional protein nucleotidyltransferase chain/domain